MQEKRILVLVNGSKANFESGLISGCISFFTEDIVRVIFEDRVGLGKTISVINEKVAVSGLAIRDEKKAVNTYKEIIRFLSSTDKDWVLLYVYSE